MAITLDFDRLLKLRLVVARFGEMDIAKWWNTRGQLGRLGTLALRRGFPRAHYFAQARSVFAVASNRCREFFAPSAGVTLWNLPEEIEEEFDSRWEQWLDSADQWIPFFQKLEIIQQGELKEVLQSLVIITDAEQEVFSLLRRTAEGRAVKLPTIFTGTDQDVALLALGFGRGEPGSLAVPYSEIG